MGQNTNQHQNIVAKKIIHRGERRIELNFKYDQQIINYVKTIPGACWSKTLGSWHVPDNEASKCLLSGFSIKVTKQGLNEYCRIETGARNVSKHKPLILNEHQAESITKFTKWLKGQRYSEKTIVTYTEAMRTFLTFCKGKSAEDVENSDIVRFNNDFILKNHYSASFQNQVISAIKLFYKVIERRLLETEEIIRPRKQMKLPEILSHEEVERLIKGTYNLKHKVILSLIYACGLRRSELLGLRITSVDGKRKVLVIRQAKGMKDRIVPLPEKMLEMLREYYKQYRPGILVVRKSKAGSTV